MGGMMFARHGGYAEYITVNEKNVIAIDSDLSYEKLAALPEAYLTVWGALDKNLQIAEGETLLVRGATSSIGLAAVTYAKMRGLTVIATTRNANSLDKLKSTGADHVVIDDGAIHEKVRAIVPEGVDNAIEIVGAATVKDTLKCVRRWGQVLCLMCFCLHCPRQFGDKVQRLKYDWWCHGPSQSLDRSPVSPSPG